MTQGVSRGYSVIFAPAKIEIVRMFGLSIYLGLGLDVSHE